ncbi:unnamed protein product [Ilex paraguariensis]|uniref:Uncharacterized protein n=1 Tax=Ilex paraguariensis TaxID=185542 RepID=A0ABC8TST6_9AQUA
MLIIETALVLIRILGFQSNVVLWVLLMMTIRWISDKEMPNDKRRIVMLKKKSGDVTPSTRPKTRTMTTANERWTEMFRGKDHGLHSLLVWVFFVRGVVAVGYLVVPIKARIVSRSGITKLPEARVNAKVNPDGTKELSSNAPLGSHLIDKGITGQTQVQTGEVAIGEIPLADISRSSGETSKKPIDVDVLPKDKQNWTKTQPNLSEAQQKHHEPRTPWNQAKIVVEEQASVQNLCTDQPVLFIDKGKAMTSVVLDTETVETNKKRAADNLLVPGTGIEGHPQIDIQVT